MNDDLPMEVFQEYEAEIERLKGELAKCDDDPERRKAIKKGILDLLEMLSARE